MASDDVDDKELSELLDSALHDFEKPSELVESSSASSGVAVGGKDSTATVGKSTASKKKTKPQSGRGEVDFDQEASKLAEMLSTSLDPNGSPEGFDDENLEKLLAMMQFSLGDLMHDPPPTSARSTNSPPPPVDASPLFSSLEALSSSLPQFPAASTLLHSPRGDGEEALLGAMLGPLLSREVVYTPLRELCDAYPLWLSQQEEGSSKEARVLQCSLLHQVCAEYERLPGSDQLPVDRVKKVAGLLEEAMKAGPPPAELTEGSEGADPAECKSM